MKKFLIILLSTVAFAGLITFNTGCKTNVVTSNNGVLTTNTTSGVVSVGGIVIDPVATGNAIRIAAKLGAMAEIKNDPSTRQYFQLSAAGLGAIIAAGNYSPTNVQSSLDSLTGNSTVSMSIADALSLYQDFFGKLVAEKLDSKSPYTVPVLTGLALGLQDAVNLTASNSTSTSSSTVNTIPAPTNQ